METYKINMQTYHNGIDNTNKDSYIGNPIKTSKAGEKNLEKIKFQRPELGKNIKFSYIVDQDTGKIRIKVYDFLTGEVIQEIPSDKFLDFLKEIKKGLDEDTLKKHELIPTGMFFENTI
ncbi:MAG: hypothetical protein KatS3mg129_1855 [Leptospiraceae bacterium]|nr:MAG: hypothetical protein KatS3mg129_1855 [Leptospiraceae bacterium]